MKLTDYINGGRGGKEARRIELEAMRDPLLHDALEGFDTVAGDHGEAIRRLRKRVATQSAVQPRRRKLGFYRRSAVAAVALLCMAVGGLYMLRESHDRAVYSDVLLPEDLTPVDFETLRRMESVIKVETQAATRAERSGPAPARELRRQIDAPAIRELSQTQLDSLTALYSFENFVDNNMVVTTDGSGVRVSGTAVAEFTADGDGHPRNIRILESPAPAASREAVRLIRNAPEWPNGMTIRVEVAF